MNVSQQFRYIGPKPRPCGCKGIRSCRLCLSSTESCTDSTPVSVFHYCQHCRKAWLVSNEKPQQSCSSQHKTHEIKLSQSPEQIPASNGCHSLSPSAAAVNNCENNSPLSDKNGEQKGCKDASFKSLPGDVYSCDHINSTQDIDFDGIVIVDNFVTEEEETYLNSMISSGHFVNSQSGRKKQDYGPKVNFKKQKLRVQDFKGLPSYSRFLYDRMKTNPQLRNFEPVELCNLEYCQERGAHIDPHFDDFWLWGERLVTLNLLSDSVLTFSQDSNPGITVKVPLQRRSLIIVASDARHMWKHCIMSEDISERRLAMTFRELSDEFSSGGSREQEGADLIKLALTFEGCAVSG